VNYQDFYAESSKPNPSSPTVRFVFFDENECWNGSGNWAEAFPKDCHLHKLFFPLSIKIKFVLDKIIKVHEIELDLSHSVLKPVLDLLKKESVQKIVLENDRHFSLHSCFANFALLEIDPNSQY
jgi:hypothetical protein